MLARLLCTRGFKPYSAWKAEQLGVSESHYLTKKKEFETGAYDIWRDKEILCSRVNFVLDHVPQAEQTEYLKEIKTGDLMLYLVNNIEYVDEESLLRLHKLKVKHHTLPVLNGLFNWSGNCIERNMIKTDTSIVHWHPNVDVALRRILLKAWELQLEELDEEVVKSNEVAKA